MLLTQDIGRYVRRPVDSENLFRSKSIAGPFLGGPVERYLAPAPECIEEKGRYHGARGVNGDCVERSSKPWHRRRNESGVQGKKRKLRPVNAGVVERITSELDLEF